MQLSAAPRSSVMAACVWALTKPGSSTWCGRSMHFRGVESRARLGRRQDRHDAARVDRDGMIVEYAAGGLDGTTQRAAISVSRVP